MRLKEAAVTDHGTSAIINDEVARGIHKDTVAALPKEDSLKRIIQRERRKHLPPVPASPAEIVLEGRWASSEAGDEWVIFNGDIAGERVIILGTDSNLDKLSRSSTWYGDGTFSVTPPMFLQLYTIHGDVDGIIHPLVFCLLPRKSGHMYMSVFEIIFQKMQDLSLDADLRKFRADFETSAFGSIERLFPNVSIELCFFHLAQANWRKIQDLGLSIRYREDKDFALKIRMLTAVAFVRPAHVRDAFAQSKEWFAEDHPDEVEVDQYISYFEMTYIGSYQTKLRPSGNGVRLVWKEPRFPPHLWSVHERTLQQEPRTT